MGIQKFMSKSRLLGTAGKKEGALKSKKVKVV
jgi:hypothetical protein